MGPFTLNVNAFYFDLFEAFVRRELVRADGTFSDTAQPKIAITPGLAKDFSAAVALGAFKDVSAFTG